MAKGESRQVTSFRDEALIPPPCGVCDELRSRMGAKAAFGRRSLIERRCFASAMPKFYLGQSGGVDTTEAVPGATPPRPPLPTMLRIVSARPTHARAKLVADPTRGRDRNSVIAQISNTARSALPFRHRRLPCHAGAARERGAQEDRSENHSHRIHRVVAAPFRLPPRSCSNLLVQGKPRQVTSFRDGALPRQNEQTSATASERNCVPRTRAASLRFVVPDDGKSP